MPLKMWDVNINKYSQNPYVVDLTTASIRILAFTTALLDSRLRVPLSGDGKAAPNRSPRAPRSTFRGWRRRVFLRRILLCVFLFQQWGQGILDACVVVTADHGHVSVQPEDMLVLPDIIVECLEYANVGVHGKVCTVVHCIFCLAWR
jgi:hypothetical protein